MGSGRDSCGWGRLTREGGGWAEIETGAGSQGTCARGHRHIDRFLLSLPSFASGPRHVRTCPRSVYQALECRRCSLRDSLGFAALAFSPGSAFMKQHMQQTRRHPLTLTSRQTAGQTKGAMPFSRTHRVPLRCSRNRLPVPRASFPQGTAVWEGLPGRAATLWDGPRQTELVIGRETWGGCGRFSDPGFAEGGCQGLIPWGQSPQARLPPGEL